MKQIFENPKTGKLSVKELVSPRAKAGGLLVKNKFSVISPGTERSIIELSQKSLLSKAKERPDYVQKFIMLVKTKGIAAAWQVAKSKLESEIALGYSTAGTVYEIGRGVEGFRAGDRVAAAGQDYASHAEFIFVPKNLAVKIPNNVRDEEAAFATMGAIVLQGIRRANLSQGEKVAVIGLGLLGQLAVRMLKAYGHPVLGFDVNKERVSDAVKAGADAGVHVGAESEENAVNGFTSGEGVDAVLIYAAAKDDKPLRLAVRVCRKEGRIVQIGNILTQIPWRDFYKKELSYLSSTSYGPGRYDPEFEEKGHDYPLGFVRWTERRNMEEFLRLLVSKKMTLDGLISATFPINEAEKAYELVFQSSRSKKSASVNATAGKPFDRAQGKQVYGILLSYPADAKPTTILNYGSPAPGVGPERFALAQKTINIGLIGLGSFTLSTILPHLKEAADKNKEIRLSAICNSTGKKADEVARQWGANYVTNYVTNDYRKVLEDKNINLVICATRHSSHAKIAEEALSLDKNIYVEKPIALNDEELEKVIKAAEKSRGRLFTGFNRRFSTHFMEARKEFAGTAPMMILYRVNYPFSERDHWSYDLAEGGRLIGEDCHFVDAFQFLFASRPKRISGALIAPGGAISHEENVSVSIEYANGSVGTLFYSGLGSFRLPKEYIEIYGGGKAMVIDNFKKATLFRSDKQRNLSLWHQDKGYTRQLETFINVIKNGEPSPFTLAELRDVHMATFRMVDALRERRTIEFKHEG